MRSTRKDNTYFAYTEPEKAEILEQIGKEKYTIQRSKGLGENEPEMMWLTTMNPESRRLIKVTAHRRRARPPRCLTCFWGTTWPAARSISPSTAAEYLDELDVSLRRRGRPNDGEENCKKQKEPPPRPAPSWATRWRSSAPAASWSSPITETLESNYMPYAMSVIVSRALPGDRRLQALPTASCCTPCTSMGLLKGARTKSANIVGSTMHLNPHGDAAIYETMVRMARGNESLLVPYVDSKGNFGKAYSRDMAYAASRYTEAKLEHDVRGAVPGHRQGHRGLCAQLRRHHHGAHPAAGHLPHHPGQQQHWASRWAWPPTSVPSTWRELCETTIALHEGSEHDDLSATAARPGFCGRRLHPLRRDGDWRTSTRPAGAACGCGPATSTTKTATCMEITQIPPTTTVEAIMDKIADLVKAGRVKEISDMRDETDLNGLKLTIDLKRGQDPDKLMAQAVPPDPPGGQLLLQLQHPDGGHAPGDGRAGDPEGVDRLPRWNACAGAPDFDLQGKKKRLHLLQGLGGHPAGHRQGHPHCAGDRGGGRGGAQPDDRLRHRPGAGRVCGRDQAAPPEPGVHPQAHRRRSRTLEKEIARLEEILASPAKMRGIIMRRAGGGGQKVRPAPPQRDPLRGGERGGGDRRRRPWPDYPVHLFFTREGYFKKITPQSLRMSGEQKLKEGDRDHPGGRRRQNNGLSCCSSPTAARCTSAGPGILPTPRPACWANTCPPRLGMEEGEMPLYMAVTTDYRGHMLFLCTPTASAPGCPWTATPPSRTAKSC